MISTIPGRKGPSGEEEGFPAVTSLETKNRGIWAEERCEQAGLWFPS